MPTAIAALIPFAAAYVVGLAALVLLGPADRTEHNSGAVWRAPLPEY